MGGTWIETSRLSQDEPEMLVVSIMLTSVVAAQPAPSFSIIIEFRTPLDPRMERVVDGSWMRGLWTRFLFRDRVLAHRLLDSSCQEI